MDSRGWRSRTAWVAARACTIGAWRARSSCSARPGPRHASRGRERCGPRTLRAARGARALLRYGDVRAGGRERAQRMSTANLPALCSWSGGKDSCLALHLALESGIRVTRLLTVFEPDADRSRSHAL